MEQNKVMTSNADAYAVDVFNYTIPQLGEESCHYQNGMVEIYIKNKFFQRLSLTTRNHSEDAD